MRTIFLLIFIILSSCSMRLVHMRAMQPALITVPTEVNTILLLDRSSPESKEKEIIGSILSADTPGDRNAVIAQFFSGIESQFSAVNRFQTIKATESLPGTNLSSAFPVQFAWEQVETLCDKYEADAIISLEVLSTRFLVTNGTRMTTKKVGEVNIPFPQIYAKGVATADIGVRLYDPVLQKVVDEFLFSSTRDWEVNGVTIADAVRLLIDKTEALRDVSFAAGLQYGSRLSPEPIRITREFYKKPKRNAAMERGRRQADTRLWKEAAETWENGIENSNNKTAGRLAYNVAIAYEVLGSFDLAIQWAQTSYVEFGNKKAKEYSDMLHRRLSRENILKDQLN